MDEEDGCSIDLYRNLSGGQNTNAAAKHESHLLKKNKKRSTGCNFGGTIVMSVMRQAAEETDKHAACGRAVQKPRQKVSKTAVIPHYLFLSPLRPSGYASRLQDDSLTASFQEINQSAGNEESDRRKQTRGEGAGIPHWDHNTNNYSLFSLWMKWK